MNRLNKIILLSVIFALSIVFFNPQDLLSRTKPIKYCKGSLKECVDQKVKRAGVMSKFVMNHIIERTPTHRYDNYVDFDDDQTVVYTKNKISCKKKVLVTGKVFKVTGPRNYKAYQIIASQLKCMNK